LKSVVELDSIISFLEEDLLRVERLLRDGARSVAAMIPEVGEHTFASGGKRIRPVMVLLTSRLCGYRGPRAIQVAAAVEYFHNASLLHDDVVDAADVRRGRPSVNARFGEQLAILVGDFMYARACQMLVDDGSMDIISVYAEALRQMTEGEVLQLSRSFDPDVSESTYMEVIGRKTASLLAAAAESGAILGGVTRAERRGVRDYGWELGLAFQLVDDALDYRSTGERLGKPALQDASEGKVTLPLLTALKRCSVGERDTIGSILKSFGREASQGGGPPDPAEVARVAACVERHHGVEITLARAGQRAAEARAKIEHFVDCQAKQTLLELTEFVVQRER
jgi:octaprenyl-diphosphate synthase